MRLLLCGLLTALLIQPAMAQEMKSLSRSEIDLRIKQVIYDHTTLGVELYNSGKQNDCLRIYQATLMSVIPLLDHRPDLSGRVKMKLEKIKGMKADDAAFLLREAMDDVAKTVSTSTKPLWDRLGGQKAVEAVIHEFVGRAAGDAKVNFLRNGQFKLDAAGVAKLEARLVQLVSAISGGPIKYEGRDMKSAHAGMKITDAEFDALAGHLVATLQSFKVPQAELDELIGIVSSTRKDIVEVSKKPLWDRLGGEAAVRAVVVEFLTTAAKDPKANIDRNGNYPLTKERGERVTQLVVEFVSSATGGPLKYTGRDMKNSHQGMKITEDEFKAAAGHLVAALKKYNVPQEEMDEFIAVVGSTMKDMVEVKK